MSEAAADPGPWLEWLKIVTPFIAALVTLLGGLFVYFLQRRHEREEKLRIERQDIYRRYLIAIENRAGIEEIGEQPLQGFKVMQAASPLHEELVLVAPDSVVEASLGFMNAHAAASLYPVKTPYNGVSLTNEEWDRHLEQIRVLHKAKFDLLSAMRKDVLSGTKVAGSLKSVEELIARK